MISRILSVIILVPLAIILVVFCVVNREMTTVSLDPLGSLPQLSFGAPLFVLLMGALIVGLILGGIGTWLTQAHYRRRSWKRKQEVDRLRREADEAKVRMKQMEEDRAKASAAAQPQIGEQPSSKTPLLTARAA